jgi:hypothetical protein
MKKKTSMCPKKRREFMKHVIERAAKCQSNNEFEVEV